MNKGTDIEALIADMKAQLPEAKAAWNDSNHGRVTLGWLYATNPVDIELLIAALEQAREVKVKQFSEFQICHYGGSEDYAKGYIDCQKNYNKALGAANILVSIKGE